MSSFVGTLPRPGSKRPLAEGGTRLWIIFAISSPILISCSSCPHPGSTTSRSAARNVALTFQRRSRRCPHPGSSPSVRYAGSNADICPPTYSGDGCQSSSPAWRRGELRSDGLDATGNRPRRAGASQGNGRAKAHLTVAQSVLCTAPGRGFVEPIT